MENKKIELIECINTFQGEGPDIGSRSLLCRFKLCNKKCPWCDTALKMRVQEELEFSLNKIQKIIDEKNCGLMITGGEPTYDKNLNYTIDLLNNIQFPFASVETNGYNIVELMKNVNGFKNIKFIVSPKVFNDKDFNDFKIIFNDILKDERIFFKIVVPDVYDSRVVQLLDEMGYNDKTYLMPKGVTNEKLQNSYSRVLDLAEEFSVNITTRLHLMYNIT